MPNSNMLFFLFVEKKKARVHVNNKLLVLRNFVLLFCFWIAHADYNFDLGM